MPWPTNPSSRTSTGSVHYGARKLGELAKIVTGKLDANKAIKDGAYPFYTCADEVLRINQTAFDGESILVAGNGDFWVKYHPSGKFNAYQRTYVIQNLSKETTTRYLYFVVSAQTPKFKKMAQGGIIKFLHLGQLQNLKIPLPLLQIQKQIVERLDKIAEAQKLNDELIQKSDELFQSLLHKELNPVGRDWPTKKLGEVLEYEQPTKYLVSSTDYRDEYMIPVLTAGKSFVLGNTNEKSGIFPKEKLPVIIFDDFTTAIKFVDFPFKVKSSAMKILHAKGNEADIRFLFYKMLTIKFAHDQHKRYWISECSNFKIPIPPLKTQKQIVAKLSAVQDYKKQLLEQKAKLKELFDSALAESMNFSRH